MAKSVTTRLRLVWVNRNLFPLHLHPDTEFAAVSEDLFERCRPSLTQFGDAILRTRILSPECGSLATVGLHPVFSISGRKYAIFPLLRSQEEDALILESLLTGRPLTGVLIPIVTLKCPETISADLGVEWECGEGIPDGRRVAYPFEVKRTSEIVNITEALTKIISHAQEC